MLNEALLDGTILTVGARVTAGRLKLIRDGLEQPSAESTVTWKFSLVQALHLEVLLVLGEDEGTVGDEEASDILVGTSWVGVLVEFLQAGLSSNSSLGSWNRGLSALARVHSELAVFSSLVDREGIDGTS